MRTDRLPPHAYFVGSAVFHYLGPAFAVLLFARVDVLGVAWLRIAAAAAVFAIWRRPWRLLARLDRRTRRTFAAWGAVLAVMNACFYLAIDRLPLGTVAAIEFLPVIALAALGTRTGRNAAALALAVGGVYLLTDVRIEGEPVGVALALANAVLFTAYIVLGHRVARGEQVSGIDGLAASMLVALVVVTPIGGVEALPAFADPIALAAGIGVGITSSVIPYVCDQLAMARLERATYALLVSLLPATATAIGILVLGQVPSSAELAGVALVVIGVAVHRERTATPSENPYSPAASIRGAADARPPQAEHPRGMTSRVTPKPCSLREAVGEHERCPGPDCAFWEEGGAIVETGCAIERLGIPVQRQRDLARHLLDLRLRLEEARTEAERRDSHRRFAELLNLDRD